MLDITPFKVMIVLLVALIVLGPDRLPRLAHQAARAWGDFQRFRHHLSSEVRDTVLGANPSSPAGTTASDREAPEPPREPRPEPIGSSSEGSEPHHTGLN